MFSLWAVLALLNLYQGKIREYFCVLIKETIHNIFIRFSLTLISDEYVVHDYVIFFVKLLLTNTLDYFIEYFSKGADLNFEPQKVV